MLIMPTPLIKKLSLKNIALHLRGILPSWAYEFLLHVRLITFPRLCKKDASFPDYTDGEWITRKPTSDLRAIVEYLHTKPITHSTILSIGVGNSYLANELHAQCKHIDGISIVPQEITLAETLGYTNYSVVLLDKYGVISPKLKGSYDFIVDNDLAGYACCLTHFHEMIQSYISLLAPQGIILTGIRGSKYFDCGFGMSERFIKILCSRHKLSWNKLTPTVIALTPETV